MSPTQRLLSGFPSSLQDRRRKKKKKKKNHNYQKTATAAKGCSTVQSAVNSCNDASVHFSRIPSHLKEQNVNTVQTVG